MNNVIILSKPETDTTETATDAALPIDVSAPADKRVSEFWRSMSELEGTKEFNAALAREFGSDTGEDSSGVNRRRFVQVMGASLALAGASGCRWDRQNIHSFTRAPSSHVPGKPKYYASAFATGAIAQPVMVTSYDFRPIKVDGNPKHPMSNGASDITTQATVLSLYDPDRSQRVLEDGKESSWTSFGTAAKTIFGALAKRGGQGLSVIAESTSSPTYLALKAEFAKAFPQAQWVWFDGASSDNSRKGAQLAFGRDVRTMLELTEAKIIVSLDDDFLGAHPAHVKYSADWAKGRKPDSRTAANTVSRLYVIESRLSVTGGRADHRLPLRSRDIKGFAVALEGAIRSGGQAEYRDPEVARFLNALVKDLTKNRGASVVTVGEGQPAEVHAVVHRINDFLSNVGKTITYLNSGDTNAPTQAQDFARVVDDMNRGQVDTVLIIGANPAYAAPKSYGFADAYAKVKNRIHLAQYVDETSRTATWHLNEAHWLESWGDARAYDGTISIVQPMIRPIYDGKSAIETLSLVIALATGNVADSGYVLTRRTFSTLTHLFADNSALAAAPNPDFDSQGHVKEGDASASAPDAKLPLVITAFDKSWRQTLFDGVVSNSQFDKVTPAIVGFDVGSVDAPAARDQAVSGELELTFYVDGRMGDGRHSNNAWLQETPDFITKLTWDNALLVGPTTAKQLNVKDEQMVTVSVDGRELTVPVYIQPGQATGSMALALGYGRIAAGRVGGWKEGTLDHTISGFDANQLRDTSAVAFLSGVKITPTGETFKLASTMDHFVIDNAGF
ncbi:MAG: TAT-variant-translocated molybdopterin oxidoreductase, partial [Clostridia bacterium]|nr:TAT-variant-translocated molybdopterin oxidoreductase [Deltaproteobacteria bacterium]